MTFSPDDPEPPVRVDAFDGWVHKPYVVSSFIMPVQHTIYCPYHCAWEAVIGEDPALCDWCCQLKPCPMHAEDGTNIGPNAIEKQLAVFDPFRTEWQESRSRADVRNSRPQQKGDYIDIREL